MLESGQVELAKTGGGPSSPSQTLYPQIIREFCDTPGFFDVHVGDEQACASLGVFIATSRAKKTRAVICTINHCDLPYVQQFSTNIINQ